MNKKRGLIFVVFLLALAMVVGVEGSCDWAGGHPNCLEDLYCYVLNHGYSFCNYDPVNGVWEPSGCCYEDIGDGCYSSYHYCYGESCGWGQCCSLNSTYCSSADDETECSSRNIEADIYCLWDDEIPEEPMSEQKCVDNLDGNWLGECDCCYENTLNTYCSEQDLTCILYQSDQYEWVSWGENTCEYLNGNWTSISNPDSTANNVSDGCCGDDAFRCVGGNDCNGYFTEGECDAVADCSWQESDLGGILFLQAQNHDTLCLPIDKQLSSSKGWKWFDAPNRGIINVSINSEQLIYGFYSNEQYWFTCDAFGTDYLTSVNGSEKILAQYEHPESIDGAGNDFKDESLICYGYNYVKDNDGVVSVRSLFKKCESSPEPLYVINSIETNKDLDPHTETRAVVHIINLTKPNEDYSSNITNFQNISEMTFFMKTNNPLNQIRFCKGATCDNNLGTYTVQKAQNTNIKNWTKYTVDLSNNENLKNVDSIRLIFNQGVETTFSISNIALSFSNETYYCSSNKWIKDLDNSTYGVMACNAQESYNWTGNFCCGDDTKFGSYELYDDTEGACFMGIPVMNNNLVYNMSGNEIHKSFLYNGTHLVGCNVSINSYINSNFYSGANITHGDNSQQGSIQNDTADLCSVMQNYVCGVNNKWRNKGDNIFDNVNTDQNFSLKVSPNFNSQQCCPGNTCWNGTSCVNHTSGYNNELVCIDGNWLDAFENKKYNPKKNAYGHCSLDWCYINKTKGILDGKWNKHDYALTLSELMVYQNLELGEGNEEGVCVPSDYYIEDDYCLEGKWITRPQLIASAFLNMTNTEEIINFSLLCDKQENVLNGSFSDIVLFQGSSKVLYNNHACVLSYSKEDQEKRLLGVSGNVSAILEFMGSNKNFCSNAIDNLNGKYNNFTHCGFIDEKNLTIYINPHMNSLIIQRYSETQFSFWNTIINLITNPINTIIKLIKGPNKPVNFGRLGKMMFPEDVSNTFYIARNGDKEIFGYIRNFLDEDNFGHKNYVLVDYKNITDNICSRIYPLKLNKPENSPLPYVSLFCDPYVEEDNSHGFLVRTERMAFETSINESHFNSLTSKLRLSSEKDDDFEFMYLNFNQTPIKNKPFIVEAKLNNGNIVENVDWKMKSRYSFEGSWDLQTSFCEKENNKFNCTISDDQKDYKIIATNGSLYVEKVFTLGEEKIYSCEIKQYCNPKNVILRLSALEHAHVATKDYVGFGYSLCCDLPGVEFNSVIEDDYEDSEDYIISLRLDERQGHVSTNITGNSDYLKYLYFNSTDINFGCERKSEECNLNEICLFRFSNVTNNQSEFVSNCDYNHGSNNNYYPNYVCCNPSFG